ncbi:MAG: BCD family MFS transporter [Kouleothrix sp.]|nr:BCD family MFS transporter [Kouleothrix sp.]
MRHKIQFMLSKLGIAWMFALVTINFNRIAIFDLGITAVLITTMIGLYPFFGPLQPAFGRLTDRYPILGYRRSPYLLLGMLVGSLVFLPLPGVIAAISAGSRPALLAGFALFFMFGASIALMANTYLDLVAECTTEATRGGVLAAAWTGQTAVIVVWALVFRALMPDYSPEAMQRLYTLTPAVVMLLAVLSVIGLERRLSPAELALVRSGEMASQRESNPIRESLALLQRNRAARSFFAFILLSFPAIFLQDALQEVFGGEVLGMRVGETTVFQQIFNGTVTIGMALTAVLGARLVGSRAATASLPIAQKKRIAALGGVGAAIGLLAQAGSALAGSAVLFDLALAGLGLCVGVFTFAAVTMMSDMTVEGQTGRYLGLWSLAQAIGLGLSFLLSGALHTLLIGQGLLGAGAGYAVIFGLESACMLWCVLAVRGASVAALREQAAAPARRGDAPAAV